MTRVSQSAKLHDEKSCFSRTDEEYVGTWFGHDVYVYKDICVKRGLLATCGNKPGHYATWIGSESWFEPGATIGYPDGPKPMEDHLTTNSTSKAFLMAFAAIAVRNGFGR